MRHYGYSDVTDEKIEVQRGNIHANIIQLVVAESRVEGRQVAACPFLWTPFSVLPTTTNKIVIASQLSDRCL